MTVTPDLLCLAGQQAIPNQVLFPSLSTRFLPADPSLSTHFLPADSSWKLIPFPLPRSGIAAWPVVASLCKEGLNHLYAPCGRPRALQWLGVEAGGLLGSQLAKGGGPCVGHSLGYPESGGGFSFPV